MLFEIRGRRKRVIQVVYVFLALLLGGSLVLFGIGGDASGGLGDALGIGGHGGSGGSAEYNDEVESAQATLETDPANTAALLGLARYNYLNGQQQLELDEDQQTQVLTEDAVVSFEASIEAWERYLDENKGKADDSVATLVFRAYGNVALNSSNQAGIQRRLDGAQNTAEIVAAGRPGPQTYLDLAGAAYLAGDIKAGDKASEQALDAVDETGSTALEAELKSSKQRGRQLQRQLKQLQSDPAALEDPFGTLGGSGADGADGDGHGG
jgi:hypothetical protein